jgi:hypothetical protein
VSLPINCPPINHRRDLIQALLKMLCQLIRALLKMSSQLIRALLKMKTGAAKTSSAENAVPANTSSSQDADPATSFYPTILSLLNSSLSYDAISYSTLLKTSLISRIYEFYVTYRWLYTCTFIAIYSNSPGVCKANTTQCHHGYLHWTSILFTIHQHVVACSRKSLPRGYFMGAKMLVWSHMGPKYR